MLTLFAIISFLSLLILITSPTIVDIIFTAILFILGVALIVWKKPQKNNLLLTKPLRSLSFYSAILIVGYFSLRFYNTWICSSKIASIIAKFGIPTNVFILIATVCLSVCAVYATYAIIEQIKNIFTSLNEKPLAKNIFCCLIASIATVIISQIMLDVAVLSMGLFNFIWGTIIVFVSILIIYCLTGWIKLSISLGTGLYIIISTVSAYIYSFRGRLFEPVDILSVGTAMNVAENFSLFPIPTGIIIGMVIWIGALSFLFIKHTKKYPLLIKRRAILALCCAVGVTSVFAYSVNLKTYHWQKEGAIYNGYILDFVSKFKEMYISEPDGYSVENIEIFADKYSKSANESDKKSPHIIVIMDEAFSDLSVLGEISTNKDVTPFISSLKENTVSGYALASVYGGNTANSEYEFLTGNSMAWLSPNGVPYQQYVRSPAYSMVSYLKSNFNYQCIAMHPYLASGWNRPNAYSNLGFDKSLFIDDFPQKDYVRQYISDKEMIDTIINNYENKSKDPLFLFSVSMQNHSSYQYSGNNYKQSISLVGYDKSYPDVEQYLSLIHETDKAVEHLISYFESVDEEVVIVFFGDHQPKLDDTFYNTVNKGASSGLDDQQSKYKIPFFIWTNYDIDEKYVECTSLNYLSSYVYEVAGIPLPPYNKFLSELEEKIPSINAHGFYSLESKSFLPFNEASKNEKEWLLKYEQLQYNSLFDLENRNKKLFPTLK
ncbi:MAG: sulfatase-like hydrolase/transferase [Clostridia bacterium]|nr:sulfatase-like hydrolase/transferase [Clostridia bacterium]